MPDKSVLNVLGTIILCMTVVLSFVFPSFHISNCPEVFTEDQHSVNSYQKIPLLFIENAGQYDSKVMFCMKTPGKSLLFMKDKVIFHVQPRSNDNDENRQEDIPEIMFSLNFLDSNSSVSIHGIDKQNASINYIIGDDSSQWITDIAVFKEILYENIYKDIDLRFYESEGTLNYDFIIQPGGEVNTIKLTYEGVNGLEISGRELVTATELGEIKQSPPFIYQKIDNKKLVVDGDFYLFGNNRYGFEVASYNREYPLVIDPSIAYSTYFGGSENEYSCGIAVDSAGCVYIAGYTTSTNFPLQNYYQSSNRGDKDVFITKLAADGNSIIYSTYIGGGGDDRAKGLAIDSSGCAYVTGFTNSSNYPVLNAFQSNRSGINNDAFVTKLSAAGNSLIYSTYLGGNGDEFGYGIAVDLAGCAYITGETASEFFPVLNAFQGSAGGDKDAFVTKFSSVGNSLEYSTYLGGLQYDCGYGIAVDSSGFAYVTGITDSTDFPKQSEFQATIGGNRDVFVTKLSAAGNSLIYSTYLGGSARDVSFGICIDSSGCAYVTGYTLSTNFPTSNPYQIANGGGYDSYAAKLSSSGSSLVYSTYLGGRGNDSGFGIVVDSSNCAYITGSTESDNFPEIDSNQGFAGGADVFVTKFNAAGNNLIYSTYHGGLGEEEAYSIAVDSSGNVYITGSTASSDFPTQSPLQIANAGNRDGFIIKFAAPVTPGITVNPTSGLLTTESGGTATFTIVLTSQPSANVTIGLSSSDGTEGTVSPSSVTFTSLNWNISQTVTVTGMDDAFVDGNTGYSIITAPAISSDATYNGMDAANVAVTNNDNDTASISINPVSGLITSESGGTASFTVVLTSQPSANVAIGLNSNDLTEGTISPSSVTFTVANWNIPQTIVITGVDDSLADGNIAYSIITAPAVSLDSNYNSIDSANVSVTNNDNDSAGITVNPTEGLSTSETGSTTTFTVILNTQPTANVTIGISSDDITEGTVSPSNLLFTSANWNVPQTVTITGIDDLVADGNIIYHIITTVAISTDTNYNGINPPDVTITNQDNDTPGIAINPASGLITTESGTTVTFTVRLNTQPTANVTIRLNSDNTTEGTVTPATLVFTPANWNVPQTATVTGVDDTVVDGNIVYHIITSPAVSTDTNYNGINPVDVSVVNNDNDAATPAATGTGTVVFTTNNGAISNLVSMAVPPCGTIPGFTFSHGLFSYNVINVIPGSSATITLTLPSNMPVGTQYWKCQNGQWVNCTSLLGHDNGDNIVTLTIRDGGLGDADGIINGIIVDPGGPAQVVNSPVVSQVFVAPKQQSSSSPQLPEKLIGTPARIAVKYLNVQPQQALINQPVTIMANVTNSGDDSGKYIATLKINGQIEASKTGTVGGHAAQPVIFTIYKEKPGTYSVDINGQQSSFTIKDNLSKNSDLSTKGVLLLLLLLMVLVDVILAILLKRRCDNR